MLWGAEPRPDALPGGAPLQTPARAVPPAYVVSDQSLLQNTQETQNRSRAQLGVNFPKSARVGMHARIKCVKAAGEGMNLQQTKEQKLTISSGSWTSWSDILQVNVQR